MAIYHFAAKVISRGKGSSAVAAAAYRSASRVHDERLGRAHDFSAKAGVVHSEVLQPPDTPERWQDRATLWNEVEAGEQRKDAQLAREVEFALPRELDKAQGIALARDFVQREFVDRGMVADLNVHRDIAEDGSSKPHAHVMLSLREASATGFGAKQRDWNSTELLGHWREAWGEHVNARLAELGIDAQVDHRSLKDQGVELEPQNKLGPSGVRRDERGEAAERANDHRAIAARNGDRIIAEPHIALEAITRQQSTFTDHDLARLVHRHSDGKEQFDRALAAVRTSPEIVCLGRDGRGRERLTSREMLDVEQRLESSAEQLAEGRDHRVSVSATMRSDQLGRDRGLVLSEQQRDAFLHVTDGRDLSLVVGYAGTGKSAMLGVAKDAWESAGYRVHGAALSGMAAENLEHGSAIASRTLASWEHAWARGRDQLGRRDVIVIDEAGLVGSRQMERVLGHAKAAGAKVVMVGDAEQLQSIEAGAAFRALAERHGAVELTDVRRQHVDWQRVATRHLATERTKEALRAYNDAGLVKSHATLDDARAAVISGWDAVRREAPDKTQVMLAYTRRDVGALNRLARDRMREAGVLGLDTIIMTARGARDFAAGDRIIFLRNERSMGVKNGSLGHVERADAGRLTVGLDNGRQVHVDLKFYADLDHGYATTIHKSQGATVDRTHVLASTHMDRHATYVALSRHRDEVTLHYDRGSFATARALAAGLSRERAKDSTLDYLQPFASRRGLEPVSRQNDRFAGFSPMRPSPVIADRNPMELALRDFALAHRDTQRMQDLGLPVLPHQKLALERANHALGRQMPGHATAMRRVREAQPGPVDQARDVGRSDLAPRPGINDGRSLERDSPPSTPKRDLDRGWER
jgi:Ti-type conjugative transfer relaxase TraA